MNHMELELEGKVAAITGGSEGIGKAIAMRLAQAGAKVAICARRPDVLEQAAADIRGKTGGEVLAVVADVTAYSDLENFIQSTVQLYGGIDILVNNAGRSSAAKFDTVPDDEWDYDMRLKLFSAIKCCQLAIPYLRRAGGGRIVNITTPGGKQPPAGSVPTSVSRAAGIALTKALSKDYAGDNICVNTVCVGSIRSAQGRSAWERAGKPGTLEEHFAKAGASIPLGRIGEAEEVADLVAFLVSARAGFITGTSINIDGGVSAGV